MQHLDTVWQYDNGTTEFVDNSVEAEIASGSTFEFLGETTDYFYFGFSRRFELLIFDIETVGNYGVLTWEYTDDQNDADSWARIIPITNYSFTTDSYVAIKPRPNWAPVAFSVTKPHVVSSVPDSVIRYWLRVSAASVTTIATISEISCVPLASYTNPDLVAGALQLPDFSITTQPTFKEVEDAIARNESTIDYKTKKSWKYRTMLAEQHSDYEYNEFNLTGIMLKHRPVKSITALEIWNGAGWEVKGQARTSDYFFIPETGIVYFSRYFLLPARMALTGPMWGSWGIGEFTFAVRIGYIWGNDIDTAIEGRMIEELCTKMTAVDIFRSHDYSILTVSGSDRVTLDRKIDQWTMEIEEDIESLKGWQVV